MTATATSNASGTLVNITNGGSGYTVAPVVTVSGGTCVTRPTASATITNGSVTSIVLSGADNCTVAPTLIISAPVGGADTFVSDLYTVGSTVKHPNTFAAGTYAVTCLYGTASSTDPATMTTGTCVKTMTVKDGSVQGCSRIYGYKGTTLSDEMWSQGSFEASFRCGSRLASTGVTNPYRLAL